MKIRYLFCLLSVFLFTCALNDIPLTPSTRPTLTKLEVEITILSCEQYEYSGKYTSAKILYKIENTGTVDFDFYKLWFEVTCVDGSKFDHGAGGRGLDAGKDSTKSLLIDTKDKQAITVEMTDYELEIY